MPNIKEQIEIVRILDDMFAKEQQVKQVAETSGGDRLTLSKNLYFLVLFEVSWERTTKTRKCSGVGERSCRKKCRNQTTKPKTKTKLSIPEEIKSALSSSNEEEIIRLLIKSAPKAVSVQMIMSISKKNLN